MSPEEIGRIAGLAAEFGVRKVKLTGGEPLMRKDITDVIRSIAETEVSEISMTTNGTLLADVAVELADAGLDRVNISLDTLNNETYRRITGEDMLENVLSGIEAAIAADLTPVKINMVVLAGINDGEIERMISYAFRQGAILQLIELIDVGGGGPSPYHHDLAEVERELSRRALAVETREHMNARKKFILPDGEVEVVRPMHNSEFCMHCTRLRLTSGGYLKPCLMRNDNLVDVLTPLREGMMDEAREAFRRAVALREPYFKPMGG